MAFASNHGLSQIDGIRLKIGEKHIAPPKVTLPVGLDFGNPSDVLFTEYDFSLEENIIQWSEAKRAEEQEVERLREERRQYEELKQQEELEEQRLKDQQMQQDAAIQEPNTDCDVIKPSKEKQGAESDAPNGIISDQSNHTQGIYSTPSETSTSEKPENKAVVNQIYNSTPAWGQGMGYTDQQVQAVTTQSNTIPIASTGYYNAASDNINQIPFYAGSAILTPQPIPDNRQTEDVSRQISTGSFDYAQFETEEDPFDKLELKTLNVMDELNKVLQSAQSSSSSTVSTSQISTVNAANNSQTLGGNLQTVTGNVGHTVPAMSASNSVAHSDISKMNNYTDNDKHKTAIRATQASVNTVPSNSLQSVGSKPNIDSVSFNSSNNACIIAEDHRKMNGPQLNGYISKTVADMPSNKLQPVVNKVAGHGVYTSLKDVDYPELDSPSTEASIEIGKSGVSFKSNSVIPSMQKSHLTHRNSCPVNNHSTGNAEHKYNILDQPVNQVYNVQDITYIPSQNTLQNNSVGSYHAEKQSGFMTDFEKVFGTRSFNRQYTNAQKTDYPEFRPRSHSRGSSPVPLKSSLRSAKSVPDLTALCDDKTLGYASSRTPPASRSRTPVEMLSKSSHQNESKDVTSSRGLQHSSLSDPYNTLSYDAKELVNNITDMGFPRPRVARAVKLFGKDDRQVLDYMFLVSKFTDDGHRPDDVEIAVRLYPGQQQEIGQYLQMFKTFRELGFSDSCIKEALERHGLNEEEALNDLVTS